MRIELEHHYGWEGCEAPGATPGEAAYQAVRQTHDFLTDDNHSWADEDSRIVIRKNAKSPAFALAPAWIPDGPGALWFSVPYRVPGKALVA